MKQADGNSGWSLRSSAMAKLSVRPPVVRATTSCPSVETTWMACTTLARQALVEYGLTMPVVPRMLMPPRMPRRALVVFFAMSCPPGTLMVTSSPW